MITLGDVTITRVEELILSEPSGVFEHWNTGILNQHRDWLVPAYYNVADDTFVTSIHVWVLKTPKATVLIDPAGGNGKDRPASMRFHHLNTEFMSRLRAGGVAPEQVDMVIMTHLHVDHVGWNTRRENGRWVPTFPNATYVMSRIEVEHRDPARGATSRPPETWKPFEDSVAPVLAAGLARLVEGTETLAPGIELMQLAGHTPGHMGVRVRSGGREALFIGDVMHQPIQIRYPDWNSKYCEDRAAARETRSRVLRHVAETHCLMLPAHFGRPHGGYLRRQGDGYVFQPAETVP